MRRRNLHGNFFEPPCKYEYKKCHKLAHFYHFKAELHFSAEEFGEFRWCSFSWDPPWTTVAVSWPTAVRAASQYRTTHVVSTSEAIEQRRLYTVLCHEVLPWRWRLGSREQVNTTELLTVKKISLSYIQGGPIKMELFLSWELCDSLR